MAKGGPGGGRKAGGAGGASAAAAPAPGSTRFVTAYNPESNALIRCGRR